MVWIYIITSISALWLNHCTFFLQFKQNCGGRNTDRSRNLRYIGLDLKICSNFELITRIKNEGGSRDQSEVISILKNGDVFRISCLKSTLSRDVDWKIRKPAHTYNSLNFHRHRRDDLKTNRVKCVLLNKGFSKFPEKDNQDNWVYKLKQGGAIRWNFIQPFFSLYQIPTTAWLTVQIAFKSCWFRSNAQGPKFHPCNRNNDAARAAQGSTNAYSQD